MKITRSNYESWFLDYLEGNLDPSLADEFGLFLRDNPDLAIELEVGDALTLHSDEKIRFSAKDELKKWVRDQDMEFQERAVAYFEGDLPLSERINFEATLSEDSVSAALAQQFGKLKLASDQAIVFEHKERLKKRAYLLPLWMKVTSAAAILALAYLLLPPQQKMQPEQMVDNLKNKTPENIVVPPGSVKSGKKLMEKSVPPVMPKIIPVKQRSNLSIPKTEKKVVPEPRLITPETEPVLLKPRGISFGLPGDVGLALMKRKDPIQVSKNMELSEVLKVQLAEMRNSDDRELLSSEHVGLSGLQLFAKLTGKRLTARKGDDGMVCSISYNSRLLAFSFPVNR